MAKKRMFTMQIVDSDAFLDMPLSSQCLYFHLNMRADDDGFIGNPKRIQKLIGASEDDLKLLIAKRFVLAFEDGVIVIKHWRMHNTIQSDRYTATSYQDELSMLLIKDNKSYSLTEGISMETKCFQNVSTDKGLDIDKGLDSELDIDKEKHKSIDYQQIADMYNNTCVSFPRCTSISDKRKKSIKARLKHFCIDDFQKLFTMAQESDFLKGKNERNWSATFDWLISDTNMSKVLDGNYKNKATVQPKTSNRFNDFPQRNYGSDGMAILEQQLLGRR